MRITEFEHTYAKTFETLFADYFREIGSDVPEDILHNKLMPHILRQHEQKHIHILLALREDACIGFSIFQIDSTDSDWCKRPGWGFVREFYIVPDQRGLGYGRTLAQETQAALHDLGAVGLYLTADSGIPFWRCCGWHKTGVLCSNGLEILEK